LKDKEYVQERIPHRDPFLLVDGVTSIGETEAKAYRDILEDDPVFRGHFPGCPIYPGVLIIEGLAQTAGILLLKPGTTPLFVGIEKARFKTIVKPPCRLEYSIRLIGRKMNLAKIDATAFVDGKLSVKAVLLVTSLEQ